MKIFFAHPRHFNFDIELYQPIRESDLNTKYEFVFPHENFTQMKTKDLIEQADLVFAEVSVAGTGLGIELGWADAFKKPIACFYKSGARVSGSIPYVTETVMEYADSDDLLGKIRNYLAQRTKV